MYFEQTQPLKINNKSALLEYLDLINAYGITMNREDAEALPDDVELNIEVKGNRAFDQLKYNGHIYCCSMSVTPGLVCDLQEGRSTKLDVAVPILDPLAFGQSIQRAYCEARGVSSNDWGFVSSKIRYENMRGDSNDPDVPRPSAWRKHHIFSIQEEYRFGFTPKCAADADHQLLQFNPTDGMFGELIELP